MDDIETETYVWIDKEVGLEEGEWDFEEFRREKMRRWVGGNDEEYQGESRPCQFELRPSTAGG